MTRSLPPALPPSARFSDQAFSQGAAPGTGAPGTGPLWGLPDPDHQGEFYDGVTLRRFLAWLVDLVLVGALVMVILPFTAFAGLFFLPLLFLVVDFTYRWVTISRGSASWGMWLCGIELREGSGQRLRPTIAFLHTFGYMLTAGAVVTQILSVGLMLTTARGQSLPDLVLSTAMIRRPRG